MCEAYQGLTPLIISEMSIDQLCILAAPIGMLEKYGTKILSAAELVAHGVVQPQPPGRQSHVQRIRADKAAKKQAEKKQSKRERRRQYEENLKRMRESHEL